MTSRKSLERAAKILEIAMGMARKFKGFTVANRIAEIQFHSGYVEPGYSCESWMVATGNWNEITEWKDSQRIDISDLPRRIGDLFEKLGIACEWSDEWSSCHSCDKLFRTKPDSHSWKPSYTLTDSELLCLECAAETAIEGDSSDDDESLAITLPSFSELCHQLQRINTLPRNTDYCGIEVRLQVLGDGSWQINCGDPSYDIDHSGYWGGSAVPGNGVDFDAAEVANDLLDQVKEDFANRQD